jgi:hydroxymethylpyrimidine pyrophosphatase-like HAD family hydrolase
VGDESERARSRPRQLVLSAEATIGIGDAENDEALLHACGLSVAVANALPAVKEHADIVTTGGHGAGLQELIARLLAGDLDHLRRKSTTCA